MGNNRIPKEFYSNGKEGAVYRWNGLKKVPWDYGRKLDGVG